MESGREAKAALPPDRRVQVKLIGGADELKARPAGSDSVRARMGEERTL